MPIPPILYLNGEISIWVSILIVFILNFQVRGAKGPIFEDGPNFDMAFKLFHGKDGVIPLSEKSDLHNDSTEHEPLPIFNPLAGKAATISLSSFGPGGLFNFGNFSEKWKKQKKTEPSNKREPSSRVSICFWAPLDEFYDWQEALMLCA